MFWGTIDILMWKGLWDGIDCVFGKSQIVSITTLCIGTIILAAFGILRSAVSVPIGIIIDDKANCCTANTFLETKVSDFFLHLRVNRT